MSRFILGRLAFVALIAVIGLSAAHATTGKRVALVIGIGNYRDPLLGNLAHPKGDADAMAQKLFRE